MTRRHGVGRRGHPSCAGTHRSAQVPDELVEFPLVGVTGSFGAQLGHRHVSNQFPIRVEVSCPLVKESMPGMFGGCPCLSWTSWHKARARGFAARRSVRPLRTKALRTKAGPAVLASPVRSASPPTMGWFRPAFDCPPRGSVVNHLHSTPSCLPRAP